MILTSAHVKRIKLHEKGLKSILISNDQIIGKYIASDIKDKNGEILIGAAFDNLYILTLK